jgi:2-polyprenyl-3-methyl-5-hydroxy-6-metoxy-1,4-benzoquinol methylase
VAGYLIAAIQPILYQGLERVSPNHYSPVNTLDDTRDAGEAMKIYHEELSDVQRYLNNTKDEALEKKRPIYNGIMQAVRRYRTLDANTRMIEIGTGTGWFVLLSLLDGLNCRGMEISPQLIARAKEIGAKYSLNPDIDLGNLEETNLGKEVYDVAICSNVFEHVELWREGIKKVAESLKPGGLMFFESTNKFSFTSGEYSAFPLYGFYGWLPNSMRYGLRKKVHGEDIMKLGIDFHQFQHSELRKEFEKNGFKTILDRVEMADESAISTGFRKAVVRWSRKLPPLKAASLTFSDATRFICLK